ncbi:MULTISPECIES: AfsR/SARP family transcriptional regulator [unclassified Saccharothrix]|uniref:AfsR/SARP family transcriptional regulator n=1 Tax=unclassified Saccharothrix TaxID=2593673 RepID=UPI00307FBA25
MEFRVLGTFEVLVEGRAVPLGTPLTRAVLALLVVHADTVVDTDRLVAQLWPDRPPGSARAEIHSYLSRLRRALGPEGAACLVTRSPGYLLRVPAGALDLHRFDELVARARAARRSGAAAEALAHYRAALALWRGPALAGLPSTPALDAEADRLAEYRLEVVAESFDAALAAGESGELVAGLTALVADHPLRERLRAALMLALHRSGRQAEALRVFREGRDLLVAELGVEPGVELTGLHDRMLRGDPELRPVAAAPVPVQRVAPTSPNTLPGGLADFVGRDDEIARLEALIEDAAARGTAVVGALGGMAGVGKTVTAVHLAHRLADRYPGGRLFIDLHAHTTAAQRPVEPAQALDALLRALGVSGPHIPDGLAERSALWRDEAARRGVLVVLDNAVDAAQVRPLLPGAPGCLALVTSRRHLLDLDGALSLSLDVLPGGAAAELFARVVGDDRPAREPEATADVVGLCGNLPLAVRVAGARLRARPSWHVAHLAARLRDQRRLFAELTAGDRCVATAFALSYRQLDPVHQRVFRLLGLVPGTTFDAGVAGALVEGDAEEVLQDLVDVHLLQEPAPGRYRFHDLLARHAAATAEREEPEAERAAAVERVLDHYLREGERAHRVLDGVVAGVRDVEKVMSWFDVEHRNLAAAADLAAGLGHHRHSWRIRCSLGRYHFSRSNAVEWVAGQRQALDSARQLGDRRAEAVVLADLAAACSAAGDNVEALEHVERAIALFAEDGDQGGELRARVTASLVHVRCGRYADVLRVLPGAAELPDVDVAVRAAVHNNTGFAYCRLGRYDEALESLEEALRLYREAGMANRECLTLVSLGCLYERTGRYDDATACLSRALEVFERVGDEARLGYALGKLGVVLRAQGRAADAVEYHGRALELVRAARALELECEVLNDFAETLRAVGAGERARACQEEALVVARRVGNAVEEARAREGLTPTPRRAPDEAGGVSVRR